MSDDFAKTVEPWTRFWTDFMAGMGPAATSPVGGAPSAETAKQAQKAFLSALARYADDFMRSETFLKSMKETMDRSLAFKKQFDQFLTQAHRGMQMPAKADVEDLATMLYGVEQRVLARLSALEERIAAVEETTRGPRGATASRAPRASGRDRRRGPTPKGKKATGRTRRS